MLSYLPARHTVVAELLWVRYSEILRKDPYWLRKNMKIATEVDYDLCKHMIKRTIENPNPGLFLDAIHKSIVDCNTGISKVFTVDSSGNLPNYG